MEGRVDQSLDEMLEELDDPQVGLRSRRFSWRWLLVSVVGVICVAVIGVAAYYAVPWIASLGQGGGQEPGPVKALASQAGEAKGGQAEGDRVSPDRPSKPAKKGKARWDNLFDLGGGAETPTGPEVIGGEAGIAPEMALDAPDPNAVLPLEKAKGKCGYESQEPGIETAGYRIVHGTMAEYGSLYAMLQKNGIEPSMLLEVIDKMDKVCDPKTVRAEDAFQLYIDEQTGDFKFLQLKRSDTKIFHVLRFDSGTIDSHTVTVPTERKWVKAGGVVKGSLYVSVKNAGLEGTIVNSFMEVFGAYADFGKDTREGDTFRVIASGEWLGKEFLGYDPPQILEYNGQKTGDLIAVYYEPETGQGKYYWPDGTSLKVLVADVPLDQLRVTSPFDPNRMHPVLKVKKPHLGTDFGASSGTPIKAFDDGVVKTIGMKGAIGNMVKLDHGGGIETIYGHMSGFAKGLKKGSKVKRGQVIGYVGNTGRSTGPHLHFGLKKHGKYVDGMKYLKVKTIKEKPIKASLEDGFRKRAKTLMAMLMAIKVPDLPQKKSKK